jgi:hypothetical protein
VLPLYSSSEARETMPACSQISLKMAFPDVSPLNGIKISQLNNINCHILFKLYVLDN